MNFAIDDVTELVGAMPKALDAIVGYVSDRRQFGRSIGSFRAVTHRLADMYVATEQARAAVRLTALDCDSNAEGAPAAVGAASPLAAEHVPARNTVATRSAS